MTTHHSPQRSQEARIMTTNTEREEPSYLAFARANVRDGRDSSASIVRRLLGRVDDLEKAAKPRVIESSQELDALPFGSVVLDYYEVAWTCSRRRVDGTLSEWLCTEFSELVDSHYVLQHGPVTVLYTPEPTA